MREKLRWMMWGFIALLGLTVVPVSARAATPTRVKKTAGYYRLIPKTDKTKVSAVKNSSLAKNAAVTVQDSDDTAGQVWKLESVGNGYRLKNANSGLYLGTHTKKGNAVQVKGDKKDKTQRFVLYDAGNGDTYLKCVGTKKYLCVKEESLVYAAQKDKKAWKFKWEKTEKPSSHATIKSATYPTSIDEGSAFTLTGKLWSRYTMKSVLGAVYDKSGKAVLKKTIYPKKCTADLTEIDKALTFGKLAAGTYRYKIVVGDVAGSELSLINRSFTVGAVITVGGETLSYDSTLIDKIGHQSTGTDLEKKACASYALAYCNAILSGTTPSPHDYWLGSTTVDCVWSRGGYTTLSYSSDLAVLQAAYTQIAAGKPCILHVTGSTAQHWVTIIGYKKTAVYAKLTAADFTAIDPWDGKVITVSDKYQVKSTRRLAVKS